MRSIAIRFYSKSFKPYLTFAGVYLGVIFFILVYGVAILYPQNIEWLLQAGNADSAQHLIGWEFFRQEPWHFPLGLIENYGFPVSTSIVYTDSIPFLALLAKSFNAYLPEHFQYFGLWLMFCFVLQGQFAWLLSQSISSHLAIRLLITCFFVISPILLNRTIEHQALAAQWTILASLWLYFRPYSRKIMCFWVSLTASTLLIHAYLAMMVLSIEFAYLFKSLCGERSLSWGKCIRILIMQAVLLLLPGYITGYFVLHSPGALGLVGYQADSMNLLAPVFPTNGAISIAGGKSRPF